MWIFRKYYTIFARMKINEETRSIIAKSTIPIFIILLSKICYFCKGLPTDFLIALQ